MVENALQVIQNEVTLSKINRFFTDEEISQLVEKSGTPLYLVDEEALHDKVLELNGALQKFHGHVKIAYSIKVQF